MSPTHESLSAGSQSVASSPLGSPPYDMYFIGIIFMVNVAMDTWLIMANPGYALPLFGTTFTGAWGWLAKIQSPILHGLIGYGFLRRRRWGYRLYMAYAALGLASALVNLATIGFGRIRMIFIVSLTVISVYVFARRHVFS